MTASLRLETHSEEGTLSLGRALATALRPGMTVLLRGDLGTGKTTLVRGIGEALGITRVRSPSFTLINEYNPPRGQSSIIHADLYRLDRSGVEELALEDYLDDQCVLLVEWPERWERQPEQDTLKVSIRGASENLRFIEITSEEDTLLGLREELKDEKIYPGVGLQPALD